LVCPLFRKYHLGWYKSNTNLFEVGIGIMKMISFRLQTAHHPNLDWSPQTYETATIDGFSTPASDLNRTARIVSILSQGES